MNADTPTGPLNRGTETEWQRQEAVRHQASGGDPLYRALHEATRAPLPAQLPADFMAGIESRLRSPPADDRFEIGLMALVIGVGGLLSLLQVLPLLTSLLGGVDLRLPDASGAEFSWGLVGASGLALAALVSGLMQKIVHRDS